jgi:alkanesulfonate monooxygenase SsuD/methylene tetrahydromethanopterin reductase-like flavin-dependent oxidoreductase (luciferase family)
VRFFHFTEQPYPDAWGEKSLRINIPNRLCDPQIASALYNRYLDEWLLADELGFDIMLNEHHSTATCLAASITPFMSILARQTRRARILALGVPIANRADPVRVAEELALIDVISRGRVEMGFVKGVPFEVPVANLNPVRMVDRFWEAHDLILKAMSNHEGPFRWEGEYFHYRSVNIWPRPFQSPYPPVWSTTLSVSSAREIARHGHVVATVLTGFDAKQIFDGYRAGCAEHGRPVPGPDRFGYLALMATAGSEAEARRRGEIIRTYLHTSTTASSQFKVPPGYFSARDAGRMLKNPTLARPVTLPSGGSVVLKTATLDQLIAAGIMFCGTPDQVHDQILRFDTAMGGVDNIMLMAQAGALAHAEVADSIKVFSREVMPRLCDLQRAEPRLAATGT